MAVILLLQFGGKQVYYGNLTQGQIIALVNYLMQILNASSCSQTSSSSLPRHPLRRRVSTRFSR
ncbi:MAG: hypothetical protein ACLUSP_02500 [Christensenellales bacterium]